MSHPVPLCHPYNLLQSLLTLGDLGSLSVEGAVELVIFALERVDLLVKLGLYLGRLELQLLERLQSALHRGRQ